MTFGERRKELKRTGFKNRGKGLNPGKALKPMSDKRREELPERDRVRANVYKRDGYKCRIAPFLPDDPCMGRLTPHHLKKAGQGGAYNEENLISACAHHNDWVEDHPDEAKALGLVVSGQGR